MHFVYFPRHKVEAKKVIKGILCILYEELLINPNDFINRSGIERATMVIWDKDKCTFTDSNYLHNEIAMEGMFEGTVLTALYIDQDPQAVLKNKMGNFDEAYLQKYYARAQGKDDEKVTIASISLQIGKKPQARTKTASPPGLNIAPSKDPYITSGLT